MKNTGNVAVDNWIVTIPFERDIISTQNWCSSCQVNGKNVVLQNENWNGHLNPGDTVAGIGLIVVSDEKQKPVK